MGGHGVAAVVEDPLQITADKERSGELAGGMRVLAIVHEDHAGPGVFGEAIRERGDTLEEWMVPTSAEPPGKPLDYDAVLVLGDSNGH